ncbi:MAG TPA: NusG domain II-containing protein [Coriobacteriia bacterium]
MTRGDRIVVAVVAVLAIAAWPLASMATGGDAAVAVISGPYATYRVPLDAARRLDVRGLHGTVTVVVGAGSVRVAESDCRDHLCVERGAIAAAGMAIVCAPNGVTVRIGGRADAPDALIR